MLHKFDALSWVGVMCVVFGALGMLADGAEATCPTDLGPGTHKCCEPVGGECYSGKPSCTGSCKPTWGNSCSNWGTQWNPTACPPACLEKIDSACTMVPGATQHCTTTEYCGVQQCTVPNTGLPGWECVWKSSQLQVCTSFTADCGGNNC